MVDADILRAKSAAVRHHVSRIRARMPLDARSLEVDEDSRNVILMDLQQAIQACIDLAIHACSHEALGAPEGPAGAFALLAGKGIIDAALGVRLAGASGLRNIIVHRYGNLSMDVLASGMDAGIADLESFVDAMWRRIQG